MTAIIVGLLAEFWPIIAGAIGVAGAFLWGRANGKAQERQRTLEEYKETRKRMDEANLPDGDTSPSDWLRQRLNGRNL